MSLGNGSKHLRTLLAVGPLRGAVDHLEELLAEPPTRDVDAIAVVGDLAAPSAPDYTVVLRALGATGRPTFWVPGASDTPPGEYLSEAFNLEMAYPALRCVHASVAAGPGSVIFCGVGGEIVDRPAQVEHDPAVLRLAAWEAEYGLKALLEFVGHDKVLLFATPPEHKGLGWQGNVTVAELIKTHIPRVAIVARDSVAEGFLGRTQVVSPGRFDRGEYAVVHLPDRAVTTATFLAAARAETLQQTRW
jgi:Icc-related predicted phosphoesterase